jgi:hypothetical protein
VVELAAATEARAPAAAGAAASPVPERELGDTQPLPLVRGAPAPEVDIDVQVDFEDLPPESKPSGIGQKYVPKEEGAPLVVLGEDVQAAEMGARVELEAEHRRRRAPTILKMKVVDVPLATPVADVPDFARPRRKGSGLVAFVAVLTVLGGAGAAAFLVRGTSSERPDAAPAPGLDPAPLPPEAPAKPALEAPLPTPEPVATMPPAAPSVPPAASAATRVTTTGAKPAAAATGRPVVRPTAIKKPSSAPASPSPKPGTAKPPSAKGAIVRDSPF